MIAIYSNIKLTLHIIIVCTETDTGLMGLFGLRRLREL